MTSTLELKSGLGPVTAVGTDEFKASRAWSLRMRVALAVLIVIRLTLTADRDILALNQPYDDYWFISTADRWVWGGRYDQLVFAQLQLYAIWLKGLALVGVPARLGIDLLWLAGSLYLGAAIARFCGRKWPGMLAFVFLAFHPYSIALFDRALSENLTACLCTIAIAAMTDAWNFRGSGPNPSHRGQWLSGAIAMVAFASAYHSRKEGVVLLVPLALMFCFSLLHRDLWWKQDKRVLGMALIAGPLLATLVLGASLAAGNLARWGVFARYELAAPGYVRAIHQLNSIDPEGPTPRWVTVTAATRAKAYEISPTFRELKPYLDGPSVKEVIAQTELYSGVKGEIGNGWFYWALRDTAALAGWHSSAGAAEAHYWAMATEIEAAFEQGRLRRRSAYLPFVDPDSNKWLRLLPTAFMAELRQCFMPAAEDLRSPIEDATNLQQRVFETVAGRRRPFEQAFLNGWMIAPAGTVVRLGSAAGADASVVLQGIQRPDVPGAYPFRLLAQTAPVGAHLYVLSPDGQQADVPLTEFKAGQTHRLSSMEAAVAGIDSVSTLRHAPWADRFLPALCTAWSGAGIVMLIASLAATTIVRSQEQSVDVQVRFLLIVILTSIAARALVLGLLDSSSWSGTQARYLLPSIPLVALAGSAALWKISRFPGFRRRAAVPVGPT